MFEELFNKAKKILKTDTVLFYSWPQYANYNKHINYNVSKDEVVQISAFCHAGKFAIFRDEELLYILDNVNLRFREDFKDRSLIFTTLKIAKQVYEIKQVDVGDNKNAS